MDWSWHWWHMGGMLWWIPIVVLIFALLVRATTGNPPPQTPSHPRESPEDILKRRYASGEINEEQYRRMLDEIRR